MKSVLANNIDTLNPFLNDKVKQKLDPQINRLEAAQCNLNGFLRTG